MKLPEGIVVGVCSHTGLVRAGNEDDYLLLTLPGAGGESPVFLVGIADGMGGVAGGAEASRTALRAFGQRLLEHGAGAIEPPAVLDAFQRAAEAVLDAASAVPALRGMGTTLTVLCLGGDRATVGHVGDTRCYRLRAGRLESLMKDHVVGEGESLLTRCIGAGQRTADADVRGEDLVRADRFLLCSDGVWNVVPAAELADLLARGEPAVVAEALVRRALACGGPDNATAVVVDITSVPVTDRLVDLELPRQERPDGRDLWPRARSIGAPRWPWLLLLLAAVVLLDAGLRLAGQPGLWQLATGVRRG